MPIWRARDLWEACALLLGVWVWALTQSVGAGEQPSLPFPDTSNCRGLPFLPEPNAHPSPLWMPVMWAQGLASVVLTPIWGGVLLQPTGSISVPFLQRNGNSALPDSASPEWSSALLDFPNLVSAGFALKDGAPKNADDEERQHKPDCSELENAISFLIRYSWNNNLVII